LEYPDYSEKELKNLVSDFDELVKTLCDELKFTKERIFLFGFSQGAASNFILN
jgi:predicted esterase